MRESGSFEVWAEGISANIFCIFRTLASDDLEMKWLPFYMEAYIFSFDWALFV